MQPQGRERCPKPRGFPPALKTGPNEEDGKDPKLRWVTETVQESPGELEDQLAEDTKDQIHGKPVPLQMMGSKRMKAAEIHEEHVLQPSPAENGSQITAHPGELLQ